MAEITSIEPQVKDKTRCNVYVDGRFYCGIKLEVAIKFHLKAGMHIEKEELDKIQLETEKKSGARQGYDPPFREYENQKADLRFLGKKG